MKIYINDLEVNCVIGVFEYERIREQKVIVDFECEYSFDGTFLDYSDIANFIKSDIIESSYYTLEEGIIEIAKKLKIKFSEIEKMKLKISKPMAVKGALVAVEEVF